MSKTRPLDAIPKSGNKSPQSEIAAQRALSKLIPKAPTTTQPAIAGRKPPFWRALWPEPVTATLRGADPGLALMAEVDSVTADLRAHMPTDPYLKRLLLRHDSLLREGEGVAAQGELVSIDHYVAEKAHSYARLRRKTWPAGFSISRTAAFCAIAHGPDRTSRCVINFSLTARGHESRASFSLEIKT